MAERKVKSALEKLQDAVEAARKDGWEVSGTAHRLEEGVTEGVNL